MRFDYKTRVLPHKCRDKGTFWLAAISICCIAFACYLKSRPKQVVAALDDTDVEITTVAVAPQMPEPMWHAITVKSGDSIARVFARLNIPAKTLCQMLNNKKAKKHLAQIKPGQEIRYCVTPIYDSNKQILHALELKLSPVKSIRFAKNDDNDSYYTENIIKPTEMRIAYSSGVVDNSLFIAAKKSGLNDKLIMQLVDIFSANMDFALDLRSGDKFHILFEKQYVKDTDHEIAIGNIVAAEFSNGKKVYQAVRHADNKYYAPDGTSMQQAFSRTPVKFTRISSHFNPKRFHPIKKIVCAHKGVDYAAPIGTPVKAVANGKITFKGYKRGYGNIIEIKHNKIHTTAYAHLSRFNKDLRVGSRVTRGDIIGYVGKTGAATAPHLHYEFRINGVHKDPLKVKLPRTTPISPQEKAVFLAKADQILNDLNSRKPTVIAQN